MPEVEQHHRQLLKRPLSLTGKELMAGMGMTAGKESSSSPPPPGPPSLPTLAGFGTVVIRSAWSLDVSQLTGTLHVSGGSFETAFYVKDECPWDE